MSKTINERVFLDMVNAAASIILTHYPEHDYNQSNESLQSVNMMIILYEFDRNHFQQLLQIRANFEKGLKKRYGVKLPTGIAGMTADPQTILTKHKVPQNLRVVSGFLDTLISQLGMRIGAINITYL